MPRTEFDRPDPLAGDHIMDATARLLAPRKSTLSREGSAASRRAAPRKRRRGNAGGEGEPRAAGKEKPQRAAAPAEAGRKKRARALEANKRAARFYYSYLNSPGGQRVRDYIAQRQIPPAQPPASVWGPPRTSGTA